MRSFICIEIPEAERNRLAQLQDLLRRPGARVSWVGPGNIHLTLLFLGEIDERTVTRVREALGRAARHSQPFQLQVRGVGAFPNLRRPRVFWAGLAGDVDALRSLQAGIVTALAAEGVSGDDKPFSPHLTIGRVKDDQDPKLSKVSDLLKTQVLTGGAFTVSNSVLMKSELRPAGAIYTPLYSAALGADTQPSPLK